MIERVLGAELWIEGVGFRDLKFGREAGHREVTKISRERNDGAVLKEFD